MLLSQNDIDTVSGFATLIITAFCCQIPGGGGRRGAGPGECVGVGLFVCAGMYRGESGGVGLCVCVCVCVCVWGQLHQQMSLLSLCHQSHKHINTGDHSPPHK